jgi:hypothetical protein
MFNLLDLPTTLKQTITVPIPMGDGQTEDRQFVAIFKRLPVSAVEALTSDKETVAATLVGWEPVPGSKDKALPFTPENLAATLEVQPAEHYIARGFFEAYRNAKLGN